VVSSRLSCARASLLLRASSRSWLSQPDTWLNIASNAAAKSFSVPVDLPWSISVDASHGAESLSSFLLSLFALSFLFLSQPLIRLELSVHALAS